MDFKKGIGHFIVQVDNPYTEEYDVKGHNGEKLVRDHRFNDSDNAKRSGVIIKTAEGSGIPEGATLYFSHSIVEWREKNISQPYCLDKKNHIYRVPYKPMDYPDRLAGKGYAWELDGKVESINHWIMLEQETEDFEQTASGLFLVEKVEDVMYSSGENRPKKGYARVRFLNDYFRGMGLKEGDLVYHKKDAEYPIEINGKTYWRVFDDFLLAKVDE
jgi:hypothetical protein